MLIFVRWLPPRVVSAVVAGEDLVMTAGFYDQYPYFLIVLTDISKPQDLKHKKVAFGPIGSSQESAVRVGVRALGLEPDKDVELMRLQRRVSGLRPSKLARFPE